MRIALALAVVLTACGDPGAQEGEWVAGGWACTDPSGVTLRQPPPFFVPQPTTVTISGDTVTWSNGLVHEGTSDNRCTTVPVDTDEMGTRRSEYGMCFDADLDALVFEGGAIQWHENTPNDVVCVTDFHRPAVE